MSRKTRWLEIRNKLEALGWQPSPLVFELSESDEDDGFPWDDMKPLPWWKKLYYKVYRIYSEVWAYRLGNPRWYKRLHTRITKGYNPEDVWSIDHAFCKWIVPRLKHLKTSKQGVPSMFINGQLDGNTSDEELDAAEARWNAELDRMIWAFEFYTHDLADMCDPNGPQWQKFHAGFYSFKLYFSCLWD